VIVGNRCVGIGYDYADSDTTILFDNIMIIYLCMNGIMLQCHSLSMRPSSVINDTCAMLELLKLKRLALIPEDLLSSSSTSTSSGGNSSELVDYRLSSASTGMAGLYKRACAISPSTSSSDTGSVIRGGGAGTVVVTAATTPTTDAMPRANNNNSTGNNIDHTTIAYASNNTGLSSAWGSNNNNASAGTGGGSLMSEMEEAPDDFDNRATMAVASSLSPASSTKEYSNSMGSPVTATITASSSSSSSSSTTTSPVAVAPSRVMVVSKKTQLLLAELTQNDRIDNRSTATKSVWE